MELALRVVILALFGAILAATAFGAIVVPREKRFPVSIGVPPSVDGSVGKTFGLLLFLLAPTVIVAGALSGPYSQSSGIRWVAAPLLVFFLVMELHAIRRVRR